MKQLFYLIISVALISSFASCNNSATDDAWQNKNTEEYDSIKTNPDYKDVRSISENHTGPEGVFFKALKHGTGTEHPLQTSAVQILYSGRYPGSDSIYFNIGTKNSGVPVWKIINNSDPSFIQDYLMTRGLSFAIQNMVVGDRWEIWVPYYLGFGISDQYDSTGSTLVIKAYSTLVYDIELVAIRRYANQT